MPQGRLSLALFSLAALALPAAAAAATTDFSNGAEGWIGNADVDTTLGTPAPAFHSLVESFGLSWRNISNTAFIGDYTASPSVTISLDVLRNSITFLGNEVTRGLFVKLSDFGADGEAAPPLATLYYRLGTLAPTTTGWQNYSVTIADTSSAALPTGWGAVDGDGVLQLPEGRTFANILASVDQIEFTTFEPDFFYGFTIFDVAGDNFTVTRASAVPEPASWALLIGGMGLIGGTLRTRRAGVAFA